MILLTSLAVLAGFLCGSLCTIALVLYQLEKYFRNLQNIRDPPVIKNRRTYHKAPLCDHFAKFGGWLKITSQFQSGDQPLNWSISRMLLDGTIQQSNDDSVHYCVIQDGLLTLFDSSKVTSRKASQFYDLRDSQVHLIPDDLKDYEYYFKQYPVMLTFQQNGHAETLYLWSLTATQKEDLYLCLEINRRRYMLDNMTSHYHNNTFNKPSKFSGDKVDSAWFSLVVGRVFQIESIRQGFIDRTVAMIKQKIKRAEAGSFLASLTIVNFDIDGMPQLENVQVVDSSDHIILEGDLHFTSELNAEVASNYFSMNGILTLSLPLNLRVKLSNLKGRCRFIIKPQPSTRLWYSFLKPGPIFDLQVLPTISQVAVPQLSVLLELFRMAFTGLLQEFYIEPNYDDMALLPDAPSELNTAKLNDKQPQFDQTQLLNTTQINEDAVSLWQGSDCTRSLTSSEGEFKLSRKQRILGSLSMKKSSSSGAKLVRRNVMTGSLIDLSTGDHDYPQSPTIRKRSTSGLAELLNNFRRNSKSNLS
ncbi:hypothetical protein MIR68_011987 [Amoeboaphelidium protococcarum]|nr:hypothetical protein MIR68_011987 [Amoeboaphelidium protococcarum]